MLVVGFMDDEEFEQEIYVRIGLGYKNIPPTTNFEAEDEKKIEINYWSADTKESNCKKWNKSIHKPLLSFLQTKH